MRNRTATHHPILGILHAQGRKIAWLARRAGVSRQYASRMLHAEANANPAFRRVCSEALGLPEDLLFHPTPTPASSAEAAA